MLKVALLKTANQHGFFAEFNFASMQKFIDNYCSKFLDESINEQANDFFAKSTLGSFIYFEINFDWQLAADLNGTKIEY